MMHSKLANLHKISRYRLQYSLLILVLAALAGCRSNTLQPVTPYHGTIKYLVPYEQQVKIQIKNSYDTVVRTLVDEIKPACSCTVEWDGADDDGRAVPEGFYILLVTLESGETRSSTFFIEADH